MDDQPGQVPFDTKIQPVSPIPEGTKLPDFEPAPQGLLPVLEVPKTNSFSPKKLIPLAGGALLLIAGGALAFVYYPPSTQKVMAKMYGKLSSITTSEVAGKIDMEITLDSSSLPLGDHQVKKDGSTQVKGSFEFDMTSDISDINNPKSSGSIKLSGEGLVLAAEMRGLGKTFYFKLTEAPLLGFIDTGTVKDQWIRIESDLTKSKPGAIRGDNGTSDLTAEQKEAIKQAWEEAKVIKIDQKLPAETIEGVGTYHYRFSYDKQNVAKLIARVSEIMKKPVTEQQRLDLEKGLSQMDLKNGEIWIGKKNFLPYKLLLSLSMKSEDGKSYGTLAFNLNFKNYNKPVQIETPFPSKSIQELFGNTFDMPIPGFGTPGSNATVLPPEPHKTN